MKCTACSAENRAGWKFCAGCGARLAVICAACTAANEFGEAFCGECGASLSRAVVPALAPTPTAPPDLAPAVPSPAEVGERRQLTVRFCDLVGSTPLSQQFDAEEWRDIISRQ